MAPLKEIIDLLPTRSIPQFATRVFARQSTTTTVVATWGGDSSSSNNLSSGAIAGIVIGSIVGFLLLLWIIRSCSNLGRPGAWGNTFGEQEKPPFSGPPPTYYHQEYSDGSRRHHHRHHSRGRRSRSRHSHHERSPRRSVSRQVYVQQPIEPHPVYYARDARRASRGSRTYYG